MDKTRIEERIDQHDKDIEGLKEKYHELSIAITTMQVKLEGSIEKLENLFKNMHEVLFKYNTVIDKLEMSLVHLYEKVSNIKYQTVAICITFILALIIDNSVIEQVLLKHL